MKPSASKVNDKSNNNLNEEDEKDENTEIEREKNLERFIYYTTYEDTAFMEKLRSLFEEINQKAFNLQSPKEIYTHGLSEEERDNNEIDYISGFQLIDKVSRLTIIEGIAEKAMVKIKEAFPKTQMNSQTYMVFSDSNILFNKRLYSIFDLSLKYIKIRMNLSDILTNFDIYLKANIYKEIYDAFMNLGSILKAETLKEITNANLFPLGESLLLLERKYGDILKEEDLTGKKEEKKVKKKYSIISKLVSVTKSSNPPAIMKTKGTLLTEEGEESVLKSYNNENNKANNLNIFNDINDKNPKYKKILSRTNNINLKKGLSVDNKISQPFGEAYKRHLSTEPNETYNKRMFNIGPRVIANNKLFRSMLKKREENEHNNNISSNIFKKNIEYLSKMKKKIRGEKIWKPFKGEYDTYKQINYYAMRNNHYEEVVNNLREKYLQDKNHFYSYSELALTLSFPMIDKFRNEEYLQYMENKSKWINKNDFDRYKQPPRDKAYFPKIDKEP
jgi:regulator of sigma D